MPASISDGCAAQIKPRTTAWQEHAADPQEGRAPLRPTGPLARPRGHGAHLENPASRPLDPVACQLILLRAKRAATHDRGGLADDPRVPSPDLGSRRRTRELPGVTHRAGARPAVPVALPGGHGSV